MPWEAQVLVGEEGIKTIPAECQEKTHQRYRVKAGAWGGSGPFRGQVGPLWEGGIWTTLTDGWEDLGEEYSGSGNPKKAKARSSCGSWSKGGSADGEAAGGKHPRMLVKRADSQNPHWST